MNVDIGPFSLGVEARDSVTGFSGTVVAVCSYITGCAQLLVQPQAVCSYEWKEPRWFDHTRLVITGFNEAAAKIASTERARADNGGRVGGPGNPSEAPPMR